MVKSMPPHINQNIIEGSQRPQSVQYGTPRYCLSFSTENVYEINTYNSQNMKIVRPSIFRGWVRKVSGEVKVSFNKISLRF